MLTVHHHNDNQNSDTERSAMKMTITQFERKSMRLLAGACSLFILVALGECAFAQQNAPALGGISPVAASAAIAAPANNEAAPPAGTLQAVKQPAESVGEEEATASPAKPGGEGIKVHGHWVIDVRNPDGTLAQHRVFENSLQSGGSSVLVGMLGGYWVAGDIAILLFPPTGPGICPANGCAIVQSATTFMGSYACNSPLFNCFVGLSKTVNVIAPPYSLVLSGQLTAPQTGTIGGVATELGVCGDVSVLSPDTTITPSACTALSPTAPGAVGTPGFTNTFPAPISVSAGQIVQVTVTISFS
jgi:hypothetical protein